MGPFRGVVFLSHHTFLTTASGLLLIVLSARDEIWLDILLQTSALVSQNEENANNVPIERLSIQHPQVRDPSAALICHGAVTLVTLCFCLFCCCFCSSISARAPLITQSKLPSARQCQRVRVCPFPKTQWHWGPFSEAVVILKMSQSILRCIVVIQSGNKSHSYSALLPLMPRQRELLHILTECICEYCPSSFPSQPTLQLQQARDIFQKAIASAQPHLLSLTHGASFLIAPLWNPHAHDISVHLWMLSHAGWTVRGCTRQSRCCEHGSTIKASGC